MQPRSTSSSNGVGRVGQDEPTVAGPRAFSAEGGGGEHPEGSQVSLVLANGNRLFAQALSSFLTSAGMTVLTVTTTTGEAYAMVEEHQPDVLLIGLQSGDRDALPLVEKVRDRWPSVAVVAIMEAQDADVPADLAPLITGVVSMEMSSSALLDAIEHAGRGQWVPVIRARSAPRSHEDFLLEQLTPRELEVLQLLAEGSASQEIARRLRITTNTVRTHVQNILSKLHVNSRLGAASLAIRRGRVGMNGHGPGRY